MTKFDIFAEDKEYTLGISVNFVIWEESPDMLQTLTIAYDMVITQ